MSASNPTSSRLPLSQRAVLPAYRGASAIARRLPQPVANACARVLAVVLRYALRSRRDMVIRHQERIVDRTFTEAERRTVVAAAFASYAQYWVDFFRLTGASTERVDAGIEVEGKHHVDEALTLGKGVIMAMPHTGAWDQGGAWVGHHWPISVVAERLEPPELFAWFCQQRKANNMTIIPLGDHDAGGMLLAALRRNEVLGLLCDRDIGGGGVEVTFFGERTSLPAGPATLSLRTGAPILPVVVYQRPGRPARGVICAPIAFERTAKLRADVAALTQRVAEELETLIRVAPEQWHVLQPNWPSDPGYRSVSESRPGSATE